MPLRPYIHLMRLDKPIGILLLLYPTLMGLFLANQGHPSLRLLFIFTAGAILMRTAGCVLNDITDRHFDGFIERTKNRPLINKSVSLNTAKILALLLLSFASLLVFQLNFYSIALGVVAFLLAWSYPYTKRFFKMPQAYLGIAFSFGILMTFAEGQNRLPLSAWLLFFANMFWVLAYDTIYAMVDKADDLKLKNRIYSSAITFERWDIIAVIICYLMSLSLFANLAYFLPSPAIFCVSLVLSAWHIGRQYRKIKNRNSADCFQAFLESHWYGLVLLLGIIFSFEF